MAGAEAALAEVRRKVKLDLSHTFRPIAVKFSGRSRPEISTYIKDLSYRIRHAMGERDLNSAPSLRILATG